MTPTDEINEALLALRVAENHFAEATEPDYIDLALDEIDVAHARLRLAIRRAKAQVATLPQQGKACEEGEEK